MRYSEVQESFLKLRRLRKRRTPPSEQTDEASGLIESEQVDVEREAPVEENEFIERSEPRDNPGPPAFED